MRYSAKKVSSGSAWSLLAGGQLRVSLGISSLSCYVLTFHAHFNLLSAKGWSVWTQTWCSYVPQSIYHTELFSSCRTGILGWGISGAG